MTIPAGHYRPMAFGPIGRAWQPRRSTPAPTTSKWLDEVFPFLPADFDERYYQAAPEDQQIDCLRGGEEVELVNLTHEGRTRFNLPQVRVPVEFSRLDGGRETKDAVIDSLLLEPDQGRFMLCWRASLPLAKEYLRSAHRGRGANVAGLVPCQGIGEDVLSGFARTCWQNAFDRIGLNRQEKKQLKPLAVLATGMVTAVGLDARSRLSRRCVRRSTRLAETRFIDRLGEWIIGAAGADGPARARPRQTGCSMAASAIAECLPALGGIKPREVPLLLCVAEETRPGRITGLDR